MANKAKIWPKTPPWLGPKHPMRLWPVRPGSEPGPSETRLLWRGGNRPLNCLRIAAQWQPVPAFFFVVRAAGSATPRKCPKNRRSLSRRCPLQHPLLIVKRNCLGQLETKSGRVS